MEFRLKRTTRTLIILVVLNIFLLAASLVYIHFIFQHSVIENRKQELQRLVTIGVNSIQQYREDYASGTATRDEALKRITDQVRLLTYSEDSRPNYLFMSSYSGKMLVQPYQPELEGSDQWGLVDSKGKFIIRELVKKAKEGSGYVTYLYYPPGSAVPETKISYVVGLPEFECYIGTGMYSTDINLFVKHYFRNILITVLIILSILITSAAAVVTPVFRSIHYVADKFLNLGTAPVIDMPRIDLSQFRNGSDAQNLVRGFSELTERLVKRNRTLLQTNRERELLVKEMNHRVKNNLQIIISLLQIQLMQNDDPVIRDPFLETISRIESISIIHSMLYSNEDLSTISAEKYLVELTEYIVHSFGAENSIIFKHSVDDSHLTVDQAVSIGIIVNEAITNSIKYAFKDGEQGLIEISFRNENGCYIFQISDNGCGLPDEYLDGKTTGLGINLIRNLSRQLDADFRIDNNGGTSYRLRIC